MKNCLSAIDAHYQNQPGRTMLLCPISQPANTSLMESCNRLESRLRKMYSQTSLTLLGCSSPKWDTDTVIYIWVETGLQCICYEYHLPRHHLITLHKWLKFVHAPLTSIVLYSLLKFGCQWIAFIIAWMYWLSFSLIETLQWGDAEPSIHLALVVLITLKCKCFQK